VLRTVKAVLVAVSNLMAIRRIAPRSRAKRFRS
jgi:hypothetical protein